MEMWPGSAWRGVMHGYIGEGDYRRVAAICGHCG